jgi:hypothetical protein
VRLYFAEPEDLAKGQRVFSVRLQGQVVLEEFDISQEAGGPRRALVREFKDVEVDGELVIELSTPDDAGSMQPILCGLQAVRQ